MLIILLLLLVVAHARPIGPIPPQPFGSREVDLLNPLESPLLTPDIPNFASPVLDVDDIDMDIDIATGTDVDVSFSPDIPESSASDIPVLITPSTLPSASASVFLTVSAEPSHSPLTFPVITPSTLPSASAAVAPTVSVEPSQSPHTTDASDTSDTSDTSDSTSPLLVTPSSTPVTTVQPTSLSPSALIAPTPTPLQTPSQIPSQTPSQPEPPTDMRDTAPETTHETDQPSNQRLRGDKNRNATAPSSTTFTPTATNSPQISPQISRRPESLSSPLSTPLSTKSPRETNDTIDASAESELPTFGPEDLPIPVMSQRVTCFPASATVKLESGSIIPMHALSVGHVVHVGSGRYSQVHMFTHRVHDTLQEFVRLKTASGSVLTVSAGHYVYVGTVLKPARQVRVGDLLPVGDGGFTAVESVETVLERGLYNPQTGAGDIVVDGIKASVYTEAVKPALAHAALLPLRVAFSVFGLSTHCADHGFPPSVPLNVRSLLAAR